MSRSYRKAILTDQQQMRTYNSFAKKQANKRIRRSKNVPDGKAYHKYYETYDICDWKFYMEYDTDLYKPSYRTNWITGEIEIYMSVEEKIVELKKARRK